MFYLHDNIIVLKVSGLLIWFERHSAECTWPIHLLNRVTGYSF